LKYFAHIVALLALAASSAGASFAGQSAPQKKQSPVTPATQQTAAPSSPRAESATPREKREQAYAKLLEGQRYLSGGKSGSLTESTLSLALQAFQQAIALDPNLAEAHNALAEIALYYRNDLDGAEREASEAARIDRNSLGAHRLLSRIYTLRSNLQSNNLNKEFAERAISELREVVRLVPSDAEGWALLGEFYQALGRDEEAINAFKQWAAAPAAVDPRFYQMVTQSRDLSPEAALARLGDALSRAGRFKEAFSAILRAIALNPENNSYVEMLSEVIEAGGAEDEAAINELRRMMTTEPENVAAVRLYARALARVGRVDEAISVLRGALARRSADEQDRRLIRADLAQIYSDASRYDEAIAIYEELLKEGGVGNEALTSGENRRFATLVLQGICNLQRQAGRWADAMATVERMRRVLGANDPTVDREYIQLLMEQGKRREALQAVREARLKHPENEQLAWDEADVLTELGRVDEAVELLRGRLKGAPENFTYLLKISQLYVKANRGKEAVEAARKAVDMAPAKRLVQALIMLSSAQDRAGDAKGSEETLRRVLAKEPNNATALNNLGYYLVERNERLPEALEMIKRAVRMEPTNSSYLDSLGWAYFKLGRLDEAERHLTEAARRDATSATIQEHLGDLYHKRGKLEQARAAWQKALSLTVEAADTARLRSKLNGEVKQ
jgi:tetratricopeptide (TPR) repeat protein